MTMKMNRHQIVTNKEIVSQMTQVTRRIFIQTVVLIHVSLHLPFILPVNRGKCGQVPLIEIIQRILVEI